MSSAHIIHLGLDYGTSASKLIFRDELAPGGTRVVPILRNGQFRILSSIAVDGRLLRFGCHQAQSQSTPSWRWYESLKMRAAAEFSGTVPASVDPLPEGFTAAEFVTLTLYWLLSIAESEILRYLGWTPAQRNNLKLSHVLGMPMSFYDDPALRQHFADLGFRAALLRRERGALPGDLVTLENARALLDWSTSACPAGQGVLEAVRSESQAGLWWAATSPFVSEGRFAEIDIGAGTTNASVFSLWNTEFGNKDRLHVFGTTAVHAGMDTVDRALARWKGEPDQWSRIRGQEERWLEAGGDAACKSALSAIYQGFEQAWQRGLIKNHEYPNERHYWMKGEFQIIICGGGSLVRQIRSCLAQHPRGRALLRTVDPQLPSELTGSGMLHRSMIPFALVAYGLSDPNLPLQFLQTPREIPDRDEPISAGNSGFIPCPVCRSTSEDCSRCGGLGFLRPGETQAASRFDSFVIPTLPRPLPEEKVPLRTLSHAQNGKQRLARALPPAEPQQKSRKKPERESSVPQPGKVFHRDRTSAASKATQSPPTAPPSKASQPSLPAKPPAATSAHKPPKQTRFESLAILLQRAAAPTENPSDVGAVSVQRVVEQLRSASLVVEDRTSQGGWVWVIGGPELRTTLEALDLDEQLFTYVPNGSKATRSRPAWYWKPQ